MEKNMGDALRSALGVVQEAPLPFILLSLFTTAIITFCMLYLFLFIVAPIPRAPHPSEKTYITILPNGDTSPPQPLPCWLDKLQPNGRPSPPKAHPDPIEDAEIFMSVVVPAFNEEERLPGMLEEAVDFLQRAYGDAHGEKIEEKAPSTGSVHRRKMSLKAQANGHANGHVDGLPEHIGRGWEILVISDGSTDNTVETALKFARDHQLSQYPSHVPGPWTPDAAKASTKDSHKIPHGSIRVVALSENRGKGGAVTHGMRHVRGRYVVFADADGASRFEDLEGLVRAAGEIEDGEGRAVAIGSRAHLVGSEAVVKRSKLRNFLMHSFHLLLRLLTPPRTSRIADTQCGFKLFSRPTLPYVIPYMHFDGWIFDVEMLMLAEFSGVPMKEVAIGWKEVKGSKLNVVWDSLGMAWGLAVLRAAWMVGVYSKD